MFSIDNRGTQAIDDAFSVTQLEEGRYRVLIHISDVAYFVKTESQIDKEAHVRA